MTAGKTEMSGFFQPSILLALSLAVFVGMLVPLYEEKPRLLVEQKQLKFKLQEQEDLARSIYDYKMV